MIKKSLGVRIIIIAVLVLFLLIPLAMIKSLIDERQSFKEQAKYEISNSWANDQIVAGPVLTVNERIKQVDKLDNIYFQNSITNILPDSMSIVCELMPEIRNRGIYDVVVYNSKVTIKGTFPKVDKKISINSLESEFLSSISFSISDLRGINKTPLFDFGNDSVALSPGIVEGGVFQSGIKGDVELDLNNKTDFNFTIYLKGSERIEFLPFGQETNAKISSTWDNPSFIGSYLPIKRELTKDGFTSEWDVNYFNRSFPQIIKSGNYDYYSAKFGVNLLLPVDEYQKTMRTSKYGILIIIITFISFFMIEIFGKKVLHPVQYLLIGLALLIFYSLLLSISEYLGFQIAYIVSAVSVIALISIYVKNIYQSLRSSITIGFILTLFYAFMYGILQLQDYSLLIGNIILFLILAAIMFATRKINWFEILSKKYTP